MAAGTTTGTLGAAGATAAPARGRARARHAAFRGHRDVDVGALLVRNSAGACGVEGPGGLRGPLKGRHFSQSILQTAMGPQESDAGSTAQAHSPGRPEFLLGAQTLDVAVVRVVEGLPSCLTILLLVVVVVGILGGTLVAWLLVLARGAPGQLGPARPAEGLGLAVQVQVVRHVAEAHRPCASTRIVHAWHGLDQEGYDPD
mmetsp:Transcript_36620/g.94774  ORF Transcript_36620/g.94774 Transcript_36620/m.94774 type:complete len:201 (-) Transcript_36620:8-610(-)